MMRAVVLLVALCAAAPGLAAASMEGLDAQQTSRYMNGASEPLALMDDTVWSFSADGVSMPGGVGVSPAGDMAVVGTTQGTFYGVKVDLGVDGLDRVFGGKAAKQSWSYPSGSASPQTAPTMSEDGKIAYFGTQKNEFVAVDVATGKDHWGANKIVRTLGAISTSATLHKGMLYFGCDSFDFYAVNASTGDVNYACRTRGNMLAAPTVSEDGRYVFVPSSDTFVYAIDNTAAPNNCPPPASGKAPYPCHASFPGAGCASWNVAPTNQPLNQPAPLDTATNMLYVTTEATVGSGAAIVSMDVAGGGTWPGPKPTLVTNCSQSMQGAPVLGFEPYVLYVNCGTDLIKFNASSKTAMWTYTADGLISATPVASRQAVIIVTNDNRMISVNAMDGTENWDSDVGGTVVSQPSVDASGRVCAVTSTGNVYCYGKGGVNLIFLSVLTFIALAALLVFLCVVVREGMCGAKGDDSVRDDGYAAVSGGPAPTESTPLTA